MSDTIVARGQNESTFGKHDHASNVAATMCPCFAGPLCCAYASRMETRLWLHLLPILELKLSGGNFN